MKIDRTLVKDGLHDTEDSEQKCVLNYATGLSWGLDSMSLKFSYKFIIMNLTLE